VLNQRFRSFDFPAAQHAFEFKRISGCLALVVVVGDDKCLFSLLANVANFLFPALQFLGLIEVVVAIIAIVSLEPQGDMNSLSTSGIQK